MGAPLEPYGRRLLTHLVDERAAEFPPRVFASLPKSSDPKDGFEDVNYRQLRDMVDRAAWFLDEQLGQAQDFETFAWIGPATDFRYLILAFAAMKSKRKAFFPSPRNSLDAHLSLFQECDCKTLLVTRDMPLPVIQKILEHRPIKVIEVPALAQWLEDANGGAQITPYKYSIPFDEARLDPCIVLHTSGSTGREFPWLVQVLFAGNMELTDSDYSSQSNHDNPRLLHSNGRLP